MATTLEYLHLTTGAPLPLPEAAAPAIVVLVAEVEVAPHWQAEVSDRLVRSGCLHILAWGAECGSGDDAVDMANLQQSDFGDGLTCSSSFYGLEQPLPATDAGRVDLCLIGGRQGLSSILLS